MMSAEEVCRLCARQNGKMLSIYSEEGIITKLEYKINSYLPIKVSREDDLPLHCCCGCTSVLLAWHQMFVSCIEAEKSLKSLKIVNGFSLSPNGSYNSCMDNLDSDLEGDNLANEIASPEREKYETLCVNNKTHRPNHKHSDSIEILQETVVTNSYPCHKCRQFLGTRNDLINHLKTHKTLHSKKLKRIIKHSKPDIHKTINEQELSVQTCNNKIAATLDKSQNQNEIKVDTVLIDEESKFTKNSSIEVSVIIDNKQHPSNAGIEVKSDNNDYREEHELKLKDGNVQSQVLPEEVLREDIQDLIDSTTKTCKLCNLNFEKKIDLNHHLSSVHQVKAQKVRRKQSEIEAVAFCDVCDKGFTRKFDMIKHRKNKHNMSDHDTEASLKRTNIIKKCTIQNGDGIQMYKCDICGHIFKQSYSLMRHHTIHTGDRPYFCELCGKDFRTSSGLNRHVNEFHHAIKKFECEVCNKQFKTRATKDEHMNIHTDARPYVCDICGKAYRQKASLHVHKTYHTNNFRFSCSICGNKYRRAQELKVHNWSHTGHKPFKCQVCDVPFRLKHDLKKHSRTHM